MPARFYRWTLGLLCPFGLVSTPPAAAQVVIDERVELTDSTRAATSRLPRAVLDSIFGAHPADGLGGLSVGAKSAPGEGRPELEWIEDQSVFVVRGDTGQLTLGLQYYNFRTAQPPDDPRLKVRLHLQDTTRQVTVSLTRGRFAEEETDYEILSNYGCIPASDANYTDWINPYSLDPCTELPDTAVVALGEVVPGDTVAVAYASLGQTIDPFVYSGRWCAAKQRHTRHLLFDGNACTTDPFPGLARARLAVQQRQVELTVDVPGSGEVWPTIPSGQVQSDDYDSVIDEIAVRFTNNDEPVAGQPIDIKAKWVEESGGHVHADDGAPLSPPQQELGVFEAGTEQGEGEITEVTDGEGEIRMSYQAPAFGGKLLITAETTLDGAVVSATSDTLHIRVPNLVRLPDSEDYTKVGGTINHQGPPLFAGKDNNHWGIEAVVDSLQQIASSWREEFPNEERLQINDMSLPTGGRFDVAGTWAGSHITHRTGRDVDVRTEIPLFREGIPVRAPRTGPWSGVDEAIANTSLVYNREFEDVCEEYGGDADIHGLNTTNEHYHVDFFDENE